MQCKNNDPSLFSKLKTCESCDDRQDCWKNIIYFKNDVIEIDDRLPPVAEKQKTACFDQFDHEKALSQWIENVIETRKAGRCYIHKALPNPFQHNELVFIWKEGRNGKKAFCFKHGKNISEKLLNGLRYIHEKEKPY
jgi:hypothetical protein